MIVASYRGPVDFVHGPRGAEPVAAGGGLVELLRPTLRDPANRWVAADTGAAGAAGAGMAASELEYVSIPAAVNHGFYGLIANGLLWNVFHGLAPPPGLAADGRLRQGWRCYRRANRLYAERIAALARPEELVVIHDYHLMLVPGFLAAARPDLRIAYFHHIPFVTAAELGSIPPVIVDDTLEALANVPVGFQAARWEAAYRECQALRRAGKTIRTFVVPAAPSEDELRKLAGAPEVASARRRIRSDAAGERLVVRVDRSDPMKNIVLGIQTTDLLLEREPWLRGRFRFLHHVVPTRQSVPGYEDYLREIRDMASAVNRRWRSGAWQPIELALRNDRHAGIAALMEYDVLVVNPIREGMNLVAQEGPLLNTRCGVEILSTEAGAYELLEPYVLGVDPRSREATAAALTRALGMSLADRRQMADRLRQRARAIAANGSWHERVAEAAVSAR